MTICTLSQWARNLLLAGMAAALVGCATQGRLTEGDEPSQARYPVEQFVNPDDQYPIDVYDPIEGFNRHVYKFNALFDRYVFLPAVRGYQFIAPDPVETGVTNFFNNLREVTTFVNSVLQGNPEKSAETLTRFAFNTTIGLLGFLDPATDLMGISRHQEDFGQTLGYWGVDDGPFLVLPVFGPSNLRDTTGLGVDFLVIGSLLNPLGPLDLGPQQTMAVRLLLAIDLRKNIAFRYYETGSPFEYELVRMLYGKFRRLQIEK